jgi:hypothetical protein
MWSHDVQSIDLGGHLSLSDWSSTHFALRGSVWQPRADNVWRTEVARERARRILTALRLTKPGSVGFSAVCVQLPVYPVYGLPAWTSGRDNINTATVYELLADDLSTVNDLCEQQARLLDQPSASLHMALRRFNHSYGRPHREDCVVDLTIALESVLLEESNAELNYRLALRGATLLKAREDPRAVFDLLKAAYGVRSRLVHKGLTLADSSIDNVLSRLGNGLSASQFLPRYEDVVRQILRECLGRTAAGKSAKDFCRELDGAVLDALAGT